VIVGSRPLEIDVEEDMTDEDIAEDDMAEEELSTILLELNGVKKTGVQESS
jgi:hypothetical protein